MLITKQAEVKINNRNKNHFKKIGYIIDSNIITCDVLDLMISSTSIVEFTCDRCNINKKTTYQKYNQYTKCGTESYYCNKCSSIKERETCMIKYGVDHYSKTNEFKINNKKIWVENLGVDHPSKSDIVKEKTKQTWMENLGVDHPSKSDIVKEKTKQTWMGRYGVDHPMRSNIIKTMIRSTNLKSGRWYEHDIEKYNGYRKSVEKITKSNRKYLLEKWSGYDYYDSEYIRNNFNLNPTDKSCPTIDHKISVLYGYLNNISPEEISSIDNLCITKLSINSSKNSKNEFEFIIHQNYKNSYPNIL